MYNFTVFFKKENYDQRKTYPRNADRYAGSKSFKTLDAAQEFAGTVNGARVYRCGVRVF